MELFLEAMEQNEIFVRLLMNHQGDLMITISAGWYVFECFVPDELTTRPLTEDEQTLILACISLMEVMCDLSRLSDTLVRCLAYLLNCKIPVHMVCNRSNGLLKANPICEESRSLSFQLNS
jgi:hypothetical protein